MDAKIKLSSGVWVVDKEVLDKYGEEFLDRINQTGGEK